MPRFDVRYRHESIRELLAQNAPELTRRVAEILTTDDPTGKVLPRYVKLELTFAPDDINTRDLSVNVSARALLGRIGREEELNSRLRAAFIAATEERYSVGVWVTLSAHSAYGEFIPQ